MDGKIGVVMEVTEKSDIEAVETDRPAREQNLLAYKPGTIGLKQDGVCAERSYSGACGKTYELSPVNWKKGQSVLRTKLL